jgi:hypothetical protein
MKIPNPFISHTFDPEQGEVAQINQALIFWIASVTLIVVAATPLETALVPFAAILDRVYASAAWTSALQNISGKFASLDRDGMLRLVTDSAIIPAKKLLFLISFTTLLYWPLRSLKRSPWLFLGGGKRVWLAFRLFIVLAILVVPLRLQSLGDSYAHMSISPFEEPFGVLHRRLVMPAVANLVGLSGYAFYLLFSLTLAFILLYLVLIWLEKSDLKVNLVLIASLLTCSFFIYGFEMPGYPDQLAMVFLMLIMLLPLTDLGKLGLAALALVTHEASVLMLLPVALFTFSKREQHQFLILMVVYAALVAAGVGFNVQSLLEAHGDVGGKRPWEHLVEKPLLLVAGVFVAYKLFWIVNGVAVVKAWKSGGRRDALFFVTALLLPLAILPFAVDASRLAGFGFAGMLLALKFVLDRGMISPVAMTVFSILNLIIPSFYVGLNSGIVLQPGLYKLLWGWLF